MGWRWGYLLDTVSLESIVSLTGFARLSCSQNFLVFQYGYIILFNSDLLSECKQAVNACMCLVIDLVIDICGDVVI